MDNDTLADLLVVAKSIYDKQEFLSLEKGLQDEAVRRLNAYGVLSLAAIGAVVGVSTYRVEQALVGAEKPISRGRLNPAHISMLSYMLSLGTANRAWINKMLEEGTSASTITELTGVSRSTIYRKSHDE
jgi:hypothetical protein